LQRKHPGEVIKPGSRYFEALHALGGQVCHGIMIAWVRVRADEGVRTVETINRSQRFGSHGVTRGKLVAQPNHLNARVLVYQVAQPVHGVSKVDQPGARAGSFHVPGDFQHSIDVASGMRESPGSAVFAVRLAQAIF